LLTKIYSLFIGGTTTDVDINLGVKPVTMFLISLVTEALYKNPVRFISDHLKPRQIFKIPTEIMIIILSFLPEGLNIFLYLCRKNKAYYSLKDVEEIWKHICASKIPWRLKQRTRYPMLTWKQFFRKEGN
jgi:hypothetical protein